MKPEPKSRKFRYFWPTLSIECSTPSAAGGAPVNRVAEQLHGRLRCDCVVFRWLTAYGEMWYEDTQDNVRGDYTEMRASLGLKAEY